MIVVDTSVLVSILKPEQDGATFKELLKASSDVVIPSSCYLEAVMVLSANPHGRAELDGFLDQYAISILGSDARQARLAADAFERYGRGRGHPAQLNFGDCLAYAAAKAHHAPLLFKGADFGHTDITPAA